MNTSTAWDKFQGATLTLTRSGHIKERLTEAYRNHLSLVDEDDLPKELREDFRTFNHQLTRERPLLRGEDAFRATVRKMSCDEAEKIATCVVRIFSSIPRGYVNSVRTSAAQIVPLYIAEA
jgi:hypothetical protein